MAQNHSSSSNGNGEGGQESSLTCVVCNKFGWNLKILPCFHHICPTGASVEDCIDRLLENDPTGEKAQCPICKIQFEIDEIRDYLTMLPYSGKSENILCTICDTEKAASFCSKCTDGEFLCRNCCRAHLTHEYTKQHELQSVTEGIIFRANQRKLKLERLTKCTKHAGSPLLKYCLDCEQLLCNTCETLHDPGHFDKIQLADKVEIETRKELSDFAIECENSWDKILKEASQRLLDKNQLLLHHEKDTVLMEVREQIMQVIKLLEAREYEIRMELLNRITAKQHTFNVKGYLLKSYNEQVQIYKNYMQCQLAHITGPELLKMRKVLLKQKDSLKTETERVIGLNSYDEFIEKGFFYYVDTKGLEEAKIGIKKLGSIFYTNGTEFRTGNQVFPDPPQNPLSEVSRERQDIKEIATITITNATTPKPTVGKMSKVIYPKYVTKLNTESKPQTNPSEDPTIGQSNGRVIFLRSPNSKIDASKVEESSEQRNNTESAINPAISKENDKCNSKMIDSENSDDMMEVIKEDSNYQDNPSKEATTGPNNGRFEVSSSSKVEASEDQGTNLELATGAAGSIQTTENKSKEVDSDAMIEVNPKNSKHQAEPPEKDTYGYNNGRVEIISISKNEEKQVDKSVEQSNNTKTSAATSQETDKYNFKMIDSDKADGDMMEVSLKDSKPQDNCLKDITGPNKGRVEIPSNSKPEVRRVVDSMVQKDNAVPSTSVSTEEETCDNSYNMSTAQLATVPLKNNDADENIKIKQKSMKEDSGSNSAPISKRGGARPGAGRKRHRNSQADGDMTGELNRRTSRRVSCSQAKAPKLKKLTTTSPEDHHNDDYCGVCSDGGADLICCDNCPKVFHSACHVPILSAVPGDDKWQCFFCINKSEFKKPNVYNDISLPDYIAQGNPNIKYNFMYLCKFISQVYQLDGINLFTLNYVQDYRKKHNVDPPLTLHNIRERVSGEESTKYANTESLVLDLRQLIFNVKQFFRITSKSHYTDQIESFEEGFNKILNEYYPEMTKVVYNRRSLLSPTASLRTRKSGV